MTSRGVGEFVTSRGGVGKILEEGDYVSIDLMMAALRPHMTAEDVERARRLDESVKRLAQETGISYEEARIRLFKQLEQLTMEGRP
ncbi:MAG TPA: hypothetical protein VG964_03775 [Candidatus Saccharimonadales bacterium]|nr:hypothetical protein [Candidatus Saccharimonadales bacterium]